MPSYKVFGRRLDSALAFPELARAQEEDPHSHWQLEVVDRDEPVPAAEELGEDVVYGDVRVRCYRTVGGYSLVFDDTGRFDVSGDGTVIRWYRPAGASEEAARADVLGRVLSLALHARGTLSLHASAVSLNGTGLAFIGPKYHGKSTITAALVKAGARLVSDDVVPVRSEPVPEMLPGVHHLRLWRDSAGATVGDLAVETPSQKLLVSALSSDLLEQEAVPLAGAYLLVPQAIDPSRPAARRERLPSVPAALELVHHAKLGPLLRRQEAGTLFSQAATVARHVPVHALLIQRDLSRLPEAIDALLSWHGAPSRQGSPA